MQASTAAIADSYRAQLRRFWVPLETNSTWHVSPGIDLTGYAFSWVFVALPIYFLLGRSHSSAFGIFIVTTTVTDLHRHYMLPYVYLDGDVRRSYPLRFFLLPALLFALWTQSPALGRSTLALSVPGAGAALAWLWLVVQLMRQDRGGRFQLRRALPCFLGAVAICSVLSTVENPGFDIGWAWLGGALVASLILHRLVSNDDPGDPLAGRRTHWIFPIGILGVALGVAAIPSGAVTTLTVRAPMNALLMGFLLWHFYHVVMQKYGILRIYSAKSGQAEKVPGWVDRLLLTSIIPMVVVWMGAYEADGIASAMEDGSQGLSHLVLPAFGFIERHSSVLLVGSALYGLGCLWAFAAFEWKIHRLRHAPRLCFAGGTLLFYSSFFALGFLNFYSTFAFAHGIEYIVFIWAFQRRRYRSERPHAVALQRLVAHPIAFYTSFTAIVVGAVFYARFLDRIPALASVPRVIFGETALEWIFWYTLYQGILHFYYDGFLWKMRRPELRAQM